MKVLWVTILGFVSGRTGVVVGDEAWPYDGGMEPKKGLPSGVVDKGEVLGWVHRHQPARVVLLSAYSKDRRQEYEADAFVSALLKRGDLHLLHGDPA